MTEEILVQQQLVTCKTCSIVFYTEEDKEENIECSFCLEHKEQLEDKKFLLERRLDIIEKSQVYYFPATIKLMYEVLNERNNSND